MFDHLLKPGERVEKLDTSGYVVVRKLLAIGDEIIVNTCGLFDRPIRATVEWISFNNLLKIDIQTEGAKDSYGETWPTGFYPYHMDIVWSVYKIKQAD